MSALEGTENRKWNRWRWQKKGMVSKKQEIYMYFFFGKGIRTSLLRIKRTDCHCKVTASPEKTEVMQDKFLILHYSNRDSREANRWVSKGVQDEVSRASIILPNEVQALAQAQSSKHPKKQLFHFSLKCCHCYLLQFPFLSLWLGGRNKKTHKPQHM